MRWRKRIGMIERERESMTEIQRGRKTKIHGLEDGQRGGRDNERVRYGKI